MGGGVFDGWFCEKVSNWQSWQVWFKWFKSLRSKNRAASKWNSQFTSIVFTYSTCTLHWQRQTRLTQSLWTSPWLCLCITVLFPLPRCTRQVWPTHSVSPRPTASWGTPPPCRTTWRGWCATTRRWGVSTTSLGRQGCDTALRMSSLVYLSHV